MFATPATTKWLAEKKEIELRVLLKMDTSQGYGEYTYLFLLRHIINNGTPCLDRTGVGTRSIFGTSMRFDLRREGFPLLTTKKMFWKAIVEELLWFIGGRTDAQSLAAKGVHIWDANASRAALDARNLQQYPEGQLGPIYGFQWRHFGAEYRGAHEDYTGEGVDQLAECIRLIRTEPTSRRILLSAWNPADLARMALPPCHVMCQFHVTNGALSCQLYQRSADMGLGVPFNIASYALLTHMLAHVCGLEVGEFIHVMGDCHVYENHVAPLTEQLKRDPMGFPTLRLASEIKEIDDFRAEHIELLGYQHHNVIKLEMAL